jgi:lipopolysaccharide heptosyltransferase II
VHPENILIARLSSIGDIILTTPLVRCVRLKYPDARISFLVKKKFASLVINNPHINEVLTYNDSAGKSELARITREIKHKRFDWFIDIHKSLRTSYIRLNIRFPELTSYNKRILLRTLLIRLGINRFKSVKPVYLKYFEAVESQGVEYDNLGTEVFFSTGDALFVDTLLHTEGFSEKKKLIVICPGASFANKQWLPDRFAEVADSLRCNTDNKIVLLGGPADVTLCDGIISQMKSNAVNFAGKLSLLQSAALLKKSSLVITNDSGMMHLAQSQKRPVVAIFGATSRELGFFPLPENSTVVEKELTCRPCTHKGLNHCPKKHFNCMKLISTADVINAAFRLNPGLN